MRETVARDSPGRSEGEGRVLGDNDVDSVCRGAGGKTEEKGKGSETHIFLGAETGGVVNERWGSGKISEKRPAFITWRDTERE